jgi:amino acid transporter
MNAEQKIPFWTAVLMSINIIVGGGIFAGPQSMTAVAGTLSFTAWLIAAILVFPVVWGVARAPILFPGPGGFANYASQGLNKTLGFLAQWMFLLGYTMGTASAMVTLIRIGLADRLGIPFAADYPLMTNALILVVFSALNLLPLGIVSRIQAGATLLKLTPLFIVTLLTFKYFNLELEYNVEHIAQLPLTIPTVIFGFLGFEACCSLSHLLKDGPSSVGKVVLTAFFITAVLYMIFHFGLLQIMGAENLIKDGSIGFPAYLGVDPSIMFALGIVIGGSILLSYCNSLFGVSLNNITSIMSISPLPKSKALLVHGVVVWLLLCLITNLNNIFSFTVMGVGITYLITVAAVLKRSLEQKALGQAFIMLLAFASCGVLFYCCWMDLGGTAFDRIINLSPLFVCGLAGLIAYLWHTKSQSSLATE